MDYPYKAGLSSAPPPDPQTQIQLIAEFWRDVDESGNAGEIDLEVLVPIRDAVTEALGRSPPDLKKAGSETFHAMCLIGGLADK